MVSVGETKSGRVRHVPLSEYALSWLSKVPRIVGVPQVFTKPDRTPWKDPRETFTKAKKAAGLPWVGLHDLRRFRATQWVKHGVDLRTVKELLGHSAIETTMRYAHFAPDHAVRSVRKAEEAEAQMDLEREHSGTTG